MRQYDRLSTPNGKGLGQTATLSIPLGPTYHRFDIRGQAAINNGTVADIVHNAWSKFIDRIRIKVNGQTTMDVTAEYLVLRARYHGYQLQSGVLPIFLAMPWAQTALGQDQGAYGTVGVDNMTLEIDFKNTSGNVLGEFSVYAVKSPPESFERLDNLDSPNVGFHTDIQRISRTHSSVSIDEISDLTKGTFHAVCIDVMDENIGEIELLVNNNRAMITDDATRRAQAKITKRVIQPGMTSIDFLPDNRVNDALPMAVTEFRLKLGFTQAPDAYEMFVTTLRSGL